jgi:mono/diheme cytochrome c family protein
VLVTTVLYTYIGQLVPQKEVPAPEVIQLAANLSTAELVDIGHKVVQGKGLCTTCHRNDESGRGPNLAGIATRAAERIPGMAALDYMIQSLYDPDAFVVPGREPAMDPVNRPPINLTDGEIRAVLAYLQSLGGTPTITMDTPIGPGAGAAAAPAAAAATGAAAAPAAGSEG